MQDDRWSVRCHLCRPKTLGFDPDMCPWVPLVERDSGEDGDSALGKPWKTWGRNAVEIWPSGIKAITKEHMERRLCLACVIRLPPLGWESASFHLSPSSWPSLNRQSRLLWSAPTPLCQSCCPRSYCLAPSLCKLKPWGRALCPRQHIAPRHEASTCGPWRPASCIRARLPKVGSWHSPGQATWQRVTLGVGSQTR